MVLNKKHILINIVFMLARFGHTMIPPGIYQRDGKCNFKNDRHEGSALRLCSSWWDAQVNTIDSGIHLNVVSFN